MNRVPLLIASTAISVVFWHSPAYSVIPTAEVNSPAILANTIKSAVIDAKQYAQEVTGWVNVANTYATAVQNTVAVPAAAIAQVNALYTRAQGIANSVTTLTGPTGSMWQRVQMLQTIGRGAGGLPGDIAYNADFWNTQFQRQVEENSKLLGLEEERRRVEDMFLATATANSAEAIGQLQAMQAQGQVTAANAALVQHTNQILTDAKVDQQVKESMEAAMQRAYQEARAADQREVARMIATPGNLEQSPIIWGR